MRKYVIMGIQGSGKGTHAKMLAAYFDLEHIAVGDIFRWNVQHHTKLGAQVRRTMAAGLLVGDDLVEGVVGVRLREHDWNYGFIIDGFPRNERQAEFFLQSYDLHGVIHLDLPDSEVARRVLARRLCANCGMDYSLIHNSPATEGRCDACGGELIRREDDTEEVLAVRLRDTTPRPIPCCTSSAARSTSSRWTPGPARSRSSRPSGTGSSYRPPTWPPRAARLVRISEHRPPCRS